MKKATVIMATAAIFITSARGQGFLNLNFESAYNLPGNPGEDGTLVSVTNGLPDWSAYDGSLALADVNYASNFVAGYEAQVGLDGGSLTLSGNFSAELFDNGSISQTGAVPGNAESLQFEAEGDGAGGSIEADGFSVTLGGQTLSLSTLSEGPNYNVYGANIPAAMAGQTEPLSFICEGVGSGNVILDNIEFSTTGVPEPSEWALVGLGVIWVGLRRCHKQARAETAAPLRY